MIISGKKFLDNAEAMASYLAAYDPMTDLPNRSLFLEHLQEATQAGQANPFALIILGLDRFRDINHILGPESGDQLIQQVAQRFDRSIDKSLIKARLGDDEFAVLVTLESVPLNDLCNAILEALNTPFVINDAPVDLSASIGVAQCPEHGLDANLLFQRATIALEYTKQFGCGSSTYDPANDPYTRLKQAYVGGLRSAIEKDQIALYYQPKVDISTGRTQGVEALVHWNHPSHGLLPAYQFIPVAERTGLIHALSRWVLRTSIAQCAAWRDLGLEIPVAVNLSPRNFHDPKLLDYIDQLLGEYDLSPTLLEVEITENVILTDAPHVSKAIEDLAQNGIRIFIDDFGTGYSSLGHLKKLPVAGVKIDRMFVSQIDEHEHDAAIVKSTIELGHRMGLQVVAEGVETRKVWKTLASLGCDTAQGFFMSPPRSPSYLNDWLVNSEWRVVKSSKKHPANLLKYRSRVKS